MAVEKISLEEIKMFKLREEANLYEISHAAELEEIKNNPIKTKKIIKRKADGTEEEYLFVPDGKPDETYITRCAEAVLNVLPDCNEEFIRAEMEKTGATVEEVIAYYLALVESVVEDGTIPDVDYDDISDE